MNFRTSNRDSQVNAGQHNDCIRKSTDSPISALIHPGPTTLLLTQYWPSSLAALPLFPYALRSALLDYLLRPDVREQQLYR